MSRLLISNQSGASGESCNRLADRGLIMEKRGFEARIDIFSFNCVSVCVRVRMCVYVSLRVIRVVRNRAAGSLPGQQCFCTMYHGCEDKKGVSSLLYCSLSLPLCAVLCSLLC